MKWIFKNAYYVTVKFRKQAPGLVSFKDPFWGAYFWRGLCTEWLIYAGMFSFQDRLGQCYTWKKMYHFSFVLLCFWGQFSKYKPPGGLYLEGGFNGGFFALPIWYYRFGIYILEGLIHGEAYFQDLTVFPSNCLSV